MIPRAYHVHELVRTRACRGYRTCLLLLLFPLFLLAGHYTGPDIQSERISFRNTIKGRKRESHLGSEPALLRLCIHPYTYVCRHVRTWLCVCVCWRGKGEGYVERRASSQRWNARGGLAEFSRPLKFRPVPLVGGTLEQQMTPTASACRL